MYTIKSFHSGLYDARNRPVLTGILRGVEREGLRVTPGGQMATSSHPYGLGSALTHPQITTDFSEALLEFITPPSHRVEDLFKHLYNIHGFALTQLGNELIWGSSMPCVLNADDQIPVARYGKSNNGLMKTIYRVGLGHRYGRAMQTVAGLHYNFSLPDAFWALLSQEDNSMMDLQQYKDKKYFDLIRNFRRHYWLLIYLFGASPALCTSFVKGREHDLDTLPNDPYTLYRPHATSLRMGDLGYQSSAQEALYVCYNDKQSYIRSLCTAITTPHAEYEAIGLKDADGHYNQLNTSLLQIENEFYSSIRPKRTARHGETALSALSNRGVEYIEVRCLDIDPFDPLGINKPQVRLLDTFLLYCALQSSPLTSPEESAGIMRNQKNVVNDGRNPDLLIEHPDGSQQNLREAAQQLLTAMQPVAELLDMAHDNHEHTQSVNYHERVVADATLSPSARVLAQLESDKLPYAKYALAQSQHHHQSLLEKIPNARTLERFARMAEESHEKQAELERENSSDFDRFLINYYSQYACCGTGR